MHLLKTSHWLSAGAALTLSAACNLTDAESSAAQCVSDQECVEAGGSDDLVCNQGACVVPDTWGCLEEQPPYETIPADLDSTNPRTTVTDSFGTPIAGSRVMFCRTDDPDCQDPIYDMGVTDAQGIVEARPIPGTDTFESTEAVRRFAEANPGEDFVYRVARSPDADSYHFYRREHLRWPARYAGRGIDRVGYFDLVISKGYAETVFSAYGAEFDAENPLPTVFIAAFGCDDRPEGDLVVEMETADGRVVPPNMYTDGGAPAPPGTPATLAGTDSRAIFASVELGTVHVRVRRLGEEEPIARTRLELQRNLTVYNVWIRPRFPLDSVGL